METALLQTPSLDAYWTAASTAVRPARTAGEVPAMSLDAGLPLDVARRVGVD